MTTTLTGRARRYLTDAALAFERAPVEVAVLLFLAATFSWAVETPGGQSFRTWFEVLFAGIIVFTGAWTGTVLFTARRWSAGRRWTVTLAAAVVALLTSRVLPGFEHMAEAWRGLMIAAAGGLWLLAVPAFAPIGGTATDRVRAVDGRIVLRTLGALLYAGALFAGLALALAAVDNLFELDLEGKIYAHVFGWLFVALAPWIVIGGIDDYLRPLEEGSAVAGVVHRMAAYLVPPLLALYCIILYAYAIRIGVTGEVPKNLVSPMVIAAGVLGALALFLFEPRPDRASGYRYLRFAPPLFAPLAALGVTAILMRYGQYGWTEFRLIRLLVLATLGGLTVAGTVQFARGRRYALHAVPLVMAVTLVLGAVGPWSVVATSRRDQQARLDDALREAAGGEALPLAEPRSVPAEQYDAIRGAAAYLIVNHGPAALPPSVRQYVAEPWAVHEMPERLGLRRETPGGAPVPERFVHVRTATGGGVRIDDGLVVHRVIAATEADETGPRPMVPGGTEGMITGRIAGTVASLQVAGAVLTVDLADVAAAVREDPTGRIARLPADRITADVVDATGRVRGRALVLELTGRRDALGVAITQAELLLMLER